MTSLRRLLAYNIKARRRALGLSQARLAEKIDTAPTYIAMIELEKRFPSVDMLERIANALELDAPQLFSVDSVQHETLKVMYQRLLTEIDGLVSQKIREIETNPGDISSFPLGNTASAKGRQA
jgi:transcriptional regulator with XRE-family HTH domain